MKRYSASRAFFATWSVKSYYYAGLANEKAGNLKKAATYYEKFLDLWKDADLETVEMKDARVRLNNFKT